MPRTKSRILRRTEMGHQLASMFVVSLGKASSGRDRSVDPDDVGEVRWERRRGKQEQRAAGRRPSTLGRVRLCIRILSSSQFPRTSSKPSRATMGVTGLKWRDQCRKDYVRSNRSGQAWGFDPVSRGGSFQSQIDRPWIEAGCSPSTFDALAESRVLEFLL